MLGERHDTTVVCQSEVEVLAVPREELQKSLTHESYLSSVWKAPAQKRMRLRRQMSQAMQDAPAPGEPKVQVQVQQGTGATTKLSALEFDRLLRRARMCDLKPNEPAFEQASFMLAQPLSTRCSPSS